MKCPHDPKLTTGPIGQYHCPECGLMVLAGMDHGDICDCEKPGEYDYSAMCDKCTPGWADELDLINTKHECYMAAMHLVDRLMKLDPDLDAPEGQLLKHLAMGIKYYEKAKGY